MKELSIDKPLGLINRILPANRTAESLQALRAQAEEGDSELTLEDGLLLYNERLVVPETDHLRTDLIKKVHKQVSTAHLRQDKTYQLLRARYYWRGMLADVQRFVCNCHQCKWVDVPWDKTPGSLHSLLIPDWPWQHVTMDYKSQPRDKHGFDNIFMVVDCLFKQLICTLCHKTVTAEDMTKMYLQHIYWYYGAPESIVSDRGPQFISYFWKEFCHILSIKLKLSTAFHLQTDSQTEIMNQYLNQRLQPFVNYYQDNWSELLPIMNFAQMTLLYSSIEMSPFELINSYLTRTSFDWNTPQAANVNERMSHNQAVQTAKRMKEAWNQGKKSMTRAQEKIVKDTKSKRKPIDFNVSDKVWISTKNWKTQRLSKKLDHQMTSPFLILAHKGNSYWVELLNFIKIHSVFSSDCLCKAADDPLPGQRNESLPPIVVTGDQEYEVQEIIVTKTIRGNLHYRALWIGYNEDLEWYPANNFKYFPHLLKQFHLTNSEQPGLPTGLQS